MSEPKITSVENPAASSEATTVKAIDANPSKQTSKKKAPVLLSQKRADTNIPQSEVCGENRKIVRATRRFTNNKSGGNAGNVGDFQESKTRVDDDDDNADNERLPKPKFTFGAQFKTIKDVGKEEDGGAPKKSFTFSFGSQLPAKEETKSMPFGVDFNTQAKVFTNKNLFANPMITNTKPEEVNASKSKTRQSKRLSKMRLKKDEASQSKAKPPLTITMSKRKSLKQQSVDEQPGKDLQSQIQSLNDTSKRFKAVPLVQENPLNSCDALKMRKELSQSSEDGRETPVVKSLFDIKGNSKFKAAAAQGTKAAEKSLIESSSEDNDSEDEKKQENNLPKIVFKSASDGKDCGNTKVEKFAFPKNPFIASGASAVFTSGKSLWQNPFAASKPQDENEASNSKEEKKAEIPPWLRSNETAKNDQS